MFRHERTSRSLTFVKLFAILFFFVLPLIALGGWLYYRNLLTPAGDGSVTKTIVVDEGSTHAGLARELESENIIRSALAYRIEARLKSAGLLAGQYEVTDGQSVDELLQQFDNGRVTTKLVTILPASRLSQVKEHFIEQGFSEDEVEQALRPSNYAGHPALDSLPPEGTLEGYLYPESFVVTESTPLTEIITQSLDEMNTLLTPQRKAGIRSLGLTIYEGITLTSIVEEEVTNLEDKPIVAQIFLKRLRENIPLGSDPTARYGASLLGIEESVLAESNYNTRTNAGLPPSPISNISATSLDAVISPSDTDYLYFVSGDDGTTHFSYTLEEHERNTELYCRELCQL